MAKIESGLEFDKEAHHLKMKKRMANMDCSSYLLTIPSDLYKKVRLKLINENKKLKPVLIEMLENYIKE